MEILNSSLIVFPFLLSFIFSVCATPLSLSFIRKLGLFDDPKTHKHPAVIHKKPVPRGGGIPLFVSILLASIFFIPLTNTTGMIFFSSFIALLVGVIDDKFDISPYIRFAINILCAAVIIQSGVTIPFITNPFGGILHLNTIKLSILNVSFPLSDIITLIWIVWVMNMLNWSKGVDGQMPGIVSISAFVIGLLSLRFLPDQSSLLSARLSFIIAGSSLGFLLYNFYPARIFPGYGATSMYLLLSVVSILSGAKLATAVLVMGIPMVDGIVTVGRRIATGHSPFRHDRSHLHHLLLKLGFTQPLIALFYWIVSAILGVISLTLSSRGKLFAILMVLIIIGGAILSLLFTVTIKDETNRV